MKAVIAFCVCVSCLVFLALSGRYEVAASEHGVYRVDRLTGDVTRCVKATPDPSTKLICGEIPEYALKVGASDSSASSLYEMRFPEAHAKQKAEMEKLIAEADAVISGRAVAVQPKR